jgi:hypothetical protein
MSDAHDPRPWFRPKEMGPGWTPATWQGWLITAVFCILIAATVQLIIPQSPRAVAVFPWLAGARRDLGVPITGLGLVESVMAMGLEIAAFLAVAWWTSRRTRPLD